MPGAVACVKRLLEARRPMAVASGARRDEIELVLEGAGVS
jgi:beta-phosphoglucomutase-like phosphatase (HAD superfamily)